MLNLTDAEREKFAAWLMQEAHTNQGMAEQLAALGPNMELGAKKYRTEAMAMQIVAKILADTETQTIGG